MDLQYTSSPAYHSLAPCDRQDEMPVPDDPTYWMLICNAYTCTRPTCPSPAQYAWDLISEDPGR